MTKRIKTTGARVPRIRSSSRPAAIVDAELVADALGADRVTSLPTHLSPPALLELRTQLFAALKSRGGRPGLEGTELRPRIPMSSDDWSLLEDLAKQLADDGFGPTAGQVGSQLLHAALARSRAEVGGSSAPSPTPYPMAGALPKVSSRVGEPSATYSPSPSRWYSSARQAARAHLEQSQDALGLYAAGGGADRHVAKLVIEDMEQLFVPPGLPLVDKGSSSPTTSIAIMGAAGTGKTTVAVALARAIAAETNGIALYVTSELATTEIGYKVSMLGMASKVVQWKQRSLARVGDMVGQPAALVSDVGHAGGSSGMRALEAAWQLVDSPAGELPIRCVVIDAFPLLDSSHRPDRDDVVALLQAIEGRGGSVVLVQEAAAANDFIPFVADIVFELGFHEVSETGGRIRTLGCPKSRHARALAGPHRIGFDRDRLVLSCVPR